MKWQQKLSEHGQASLPSTPTHALRHATTMFPNIRALLSILCTLPVTSCSAERSFSAVKRIKTALRSSMGTERLTGLALLHIHRDIPLETSDVIDEFARRQPRRLQTSNWGERERAPSLVHSQAGGVTIYRYMLCYIVRPSSPRINCSTLYATPVGPREIPERIRRKLYVILQKYNVNFPYIWNLQIVARGEVV